VPHIDKAHNDLNWSVSTLINKVQPEDSYKGKDIFRLDVKINHMHIM